MRLLLASLLIGALASAPVTVTACGGCGVDDVKATISPTTTCLKANAFRGWGCDTTAAIEGDNMCPSPVTISKTGTELTDDLVVQPGGSFSFDVVRADTGVIAQRSFAISIGGQSGTIDVAW